MKTTLGNGGGGGGGKGEETENFIISKKLHCSIRNASSGSRSPHLQGREVYRKGSQYRFLAAR